MPGVVNIDNALGWVADAFERITGITLADANDTRAGHAARIENIATVGVELGTVGPTGPAGPTGPTGPAGSYSYATTATGYTETATSGEKVVAVTASGQTITLSTAVGNTATLTFKLMVAGTLTLDGAGSQTVEGGLTAVLTSAGESVTLFSDNANWIVA